MSWVYFYFVVFVDINIDKYFEGDGLESKVLFDQKILFEMKKFFFIVDFIEERCFVDMYFFLEEWFNGFFNVIIND